VGDANGAATPGYPDAVTTAAALAARVLAREISAVEAVSAALKRMDALDGELHAFCTRCDERALAEAAAVDRRLDAGEAVGPLAGVPVAIKDLINTKGLRTTYGSPLYADHVPEEDDVVVERLVAAGAVVVGKTNTSEFGYGAVGDNPLFASTRNPWNPALTPGGSSAGTAAAVASGMVPFGLGSDGGVPCASRRRSAASLESSRRLAACRSIPVVATRAFRAPRAGNRSNISDRSRAASRTPRLRCR
jgi:Asp-tRNA(Asn)/Glu-tRNA(Gln) amidotransferase A subunit family amidase